MRFRQKWGHRRDSRTSSGEPDEATMPNKKDETTHPTTEEENAHPNNQERQRWEHPSMFNATGPHILSRYDVVMVKILKGNTIDAKRGVVTRCLGDNMYMVNVGASVYRKHRTQLLPLTRKLTQDSKALAKLPTSKSRIQNQRHQRKAWASSPARPGDGGTHAEALEAQAAKRGLPQKQHPANGSSNGLET
jgi:hypothetical protein